MHILRVVYNLMRVPFLPVRVLANLMRGCLHTLRVLAGIIIIMMRVLANHRSSGRVLIPIDLKQCENCYDWPNTKKL